MTCRPLLWLALALPLASSCKKDAEVLTPVEGVAQDITVTAYSDGWGTLLDTVQLDTEGDVLCDFPEEEPYSDPAAYYLFAEADGFFTEVYYCLIGENAAIDLDAVGDHPWAIAGSVFSLQSFFSPNIVAGTNITLDAKNGGFYSVTTDDQGRFGAMNLPEGEVEASLSEEGESFTFTLSNGSGVDYQDLIYNSPIQADAPNVYLYPHETTQVQVTVSFVDGGHIIASEPDYGDGWSVTVTPEGWIDETYGYLFYEAKIPPKVQTESGWLLDGADLNGELRSLLSTQGFVGREIDDFVEYWLPRLEASPWYAVYPQDADALMTLDITPQPDDILRALYLIRPVPTQLSLSEPSVVDPIDRSGFVVAEWGVLQDI